MIQYGGRRSHYNGMNWKYSESANKVLNVSLDLFILASSADNGELSNCSKSHLERRNYPSSLTRTRVKFHGIRQQSIKFPYHK